MGGIGNQLLFPVLSTAINLENDGRARSLEIQFKDLANTVEVGYKKLEGTD